MRMCNIIHLNDMCVCIIYTFFFFFFRALLMAYRGSQARGRLGAVAAGLHHSHSSAGSEPHLRPTPQLMATPDPHEQGQGSNLCLHGC